MFTPYGYSTMIKALLICMLCSGAALFFPPGVKIALLIATASFSLFTLYFFRDPERKVPNEQRIILAPADGSILLVQKQEESTLVSIFMSPFNVHVNRIPISGRVTKVNYKPGQFLMAFDNRSMESNEKMEIGIDNGEIRVLFSQVSGFLARRIVCPLQKDEQVTIGNRFGMIKFGSRVDLTLPPGATVEVQVGQKSVAGRTILARY
ncbi:phosphatidylserine decarboxylase [Chlorobium sp. BLA1]|uniref:phosphatidylserine decarboxylase n=1 Tax=Candidatus Chlorobium masyuteum TaxID=2716876 RepID=UPI001422C8CA|nr:phosphatidylserine decarboxylase [Candidatus Chlorobium masyuteum]NHQ59111.1 phosphatidylserine decarboxylase [Candidatus Chlorobium masyuteum]NTU44284.1 phosphatidylserine decarboxylase [Chlorobiaceae bacterium]